MNEEPLDKTRRQALMAFLLGSGMLGLRSLASGLPTAILANPRRAFAQQSACDSADAQYLILSTSSDGDPVNANVPGMYVDPNIVHPLGASMQPTQINLAGATYTAAHPWSTLPQAVLNRTSFFHHATYTEVHSDERRTLSLMGATAQQEMLVSILSAALAPCLGTIQAQPISLNASNVLESLSFQGRPQASLSPMALAQTLTSPQGPLLTMQARRDADVNRLSAWFKSTGNSGQSSFIDRYVTSQEQARAISQNLLQTLSSIRDNSVASQISAAAVLIQMKVTPVISIHIPFGGDNHSDANLQLESDQHVSSVASIAQLMQDLSAVSLQDSVTFALMNVFGRTLLDAANGRTHNANHHTTVMIGSGVRGSVIGGVAPTAGDYGALSIDSTSGVGGGDIAVAETFAAAGKTLGRALGVAESQLDSAINGGKPVLAALAQN